jgi:hypothetical protein
MELTTRTSTTFLQVGAAHFIGVFLIDTKNDGFRKPAGAPHKIIKMAGDRFRSRSQSDYALKILGLVFSIRIYFNIFQKISRNSKAGKGEIYLASYTLYEQTLADKPKVLNINRAWHIGQQIFFRILFFHLSLSSAVTLLEID